METCQKRDQCLGELTKSVEAIKRDTASIIVGFYGPLSKPNSGFAVEISNKLDKISDKVDVLFSERQERLEDQKKFNLGVKLAIVSACVSLVCSIIIILIKVV